MEEQPVSNIHSQDEPQHNKNLITKKHRRFQLLKLGIIALVAAAIAVYTIVDVARATKLHIQIMNLEDKVDKKIETTSLIHHLQKERGMTALILASHWRKRNAEYKDLIDCQRKVNKSILSLKSLGGSYESGTVITSKLSFLRDLQRIRKTVLGTEQTVSIKQQLNTYSKWIIELISWLPNYIAKEKFDDYSGWVYSYLMITNSKEEAGLERVLGGLYFLKGKNFTFENISWYNEKRIRARCFRDAAFSFSEAVQDIYRSLQKSNNYSLVMKKIEAKRKILISKESFTPSHEAASEWFDLMTDCNDILFELQTRVSSFVEESIKNEANLILKSLIHPLFLLFFTLLLVPGLLFSLMKVQNANCKNTISLDGKVNLEQGRTAFLMRENARHVDSKYI